MAKIDRYDGNLAAFASQADTNRRTTFGTETTGDDTLDGNLNADFFTGWQIVGPNEFPTLEDFNAAFFTIGQLMAYVHQVGMPEWNGVQEYHIGSMVNRAGVMYICTTDNHASVTPPESDATNWRLLAAGDVGYDNTASGLTSETSQAAIDETVQRQLGWDQTWQDVAASRAVNVTYTNSTQKPIAVAILAAGNGPLDNAAALQIDGVSVYSSALYDAGGSVSLNNIIIPAGSTYELTPGGLTSISIRFWRELR